MADSFADFCGGPFWNETLLVENTWPQFTDCFMHTALIWVPCAFLFLALPYYATSVKRNATAFPTGTSFLEGFKLVCCALLGVTSVVQLLHKVVDDRSWSTAAILGDALWLVAYVTMGLMTYMERVCGVQGQGTPFFFWLLSSISSVVPIYVQVHVQEHGHDPLHFSATVITAVLQIVSLALTFWVDDVSYNVIASDEKEPCPETSCSFPSFLFFYWMTKLVTTGFRRELKERDVWTLGTRERSDSLVPAFMQAWAAPREIRYTDSWKKAMSLMNGMSSSENAPLLLPSKQLDPKRDRKRRSLVRVLCRMFWADLLVCFVLKVISDFIFILSPILLNVLLASLKNDTDDRKWHGYVICVGLFLSSSVKAVFFGHALFRATRVGIRMKAVLVAAIYTKVLRMNNTARTRVTAGEILNMVSVDSQQIMERMDFVFFGITTPLQIMLVVLLLYQIIGWSVLAGMGVLLLQVPLNAWVAGRHKHYREDNLKHKDARVKLYNEILNAIKVLKLYAWEPSFHKKINEIRGKELSVLFKLVHINSITGLIWDMAPYLVMLATFSVSVTADRSHRLTVSEAFVSLAFFNILRAPLSQLAGVIVATIQSWVSIQRINRFLEEEELDEDNVTHDAESDNAISITNGSFTWHQHKKPCLRNLNVEIAPGRLVAVVGPVGCGKSSLLNAMLGEMDKVKGKVNTKGRVAYVPQQAWIQNASVQDNILFGRPFGRTHYLDTVHRCQLDRDLEILPAGDRTEIGEKGINLSGGQKQRISMARAVYSDSDVYLLDDPLSAVDAYVGKAIFKHVFDSSTGILRNKTRVLVTHGVHWLPLVDEIIVMHDGIISERGSYEELMSHDGPFAQFLKTYLCQAARDEEDEEITEIHRSMVEKLESSVDMSNDDLSDSARKARTGKSRNTGQPSVEESVALSRSLLKAAADTDTAPSDRLITTETVKSGQVAGSVFLELVRSSGPRLLFFAFLAYCAFQALSVTANFQLDWWANAPTLNSTDIDDFNDPHLALYGANGIGQALCLACFSWVFWTRMVHAARETHARLADRLLRYPMSFFDTTPVGRVLNRVAKDVETVDNQLPLIVRNFLVHSSLVLVTCIVLMIETPLTGVVLIPVVVLFYLLQKFYIPTSRQLKRIEAVTRTPLYVALCETMSGTSSIKAYSAEDRFTDTCRHLVDVNHAYFFATHGALRWLQWNLDLLASITIFAAAIFEILSSSAENGAIGLSVSYALQLSGTMIWMTKDISEFETNIVSVERLKEYSELETEADWIIEDRRPNRDWPQNGMVTFNDLQTRYREGLDLVLRGVTFTIKAGQRIENYLVANVYPSEKQALWDSLPESVPTLEAFKDGLHKVGIVGRTGAGKSSLTLSLFRLIEATGGSILIDGVNIAHMGLHDLRSRLTILPQDPVLFSGTLRMNLDPFDEYADSQLWTALDKAHLREAVEHMTDGLQFDCGDEGSNLSVGERQLVCLARVLLRRTKILVLDEATAAVDMETDSLIQDTIRSAFSQCTVIAIAHRLNTIMDYDMIVVVEEGQVKEYATPQELLADNTSAFYSMAKDAGLAA